MKILVASHNRDKVREIREILGGLPVELLSAADLSGVAAPEETGRTLEENALIKARNVFAAAREPALADDTGLEVEALGGLPGVRSSRFAGEAATYEQNVDHLLQRMQSVEPGRRGARFRTVAALVYAEGIEILTEGTCEGSILGARRGAGGFGYDPVFLVAGGDKTFAEMTPEEKNRVSHRGQALRRMRQVLGRFL
ncbi:MAG: RdgB/HAM1 family non-canonical purine NTP pyrophosphatase [Candidatus Eisenbacteria bacterium]|nr:RdgB/HAM1 family non-canonical purine NTP pyrophosphatase [Candidatus Eisenbacteria bacterium]